MAADDDAAATRRAIDAVWRIESPRLIAGLARMGRDIDRPGAELTDEGMQIVSLNHG